MEVIIVSPLISSYKYEKLGEEKGCRKVPKEIESKEREWIREKKRGSLIESLYWEQLKVGNPKPTLQTICEPNWD